jgi:hypothetical protein
MMAGGEIIAFTNNEMTDLLYHTAGANLELIICIEATGLGA